MPLMESTSNTTEDEANNTKESTFHSNKSTEGHLGKDNPSVTLISTITSADDAK